MDKQQLIATMNDAAPHADDCVEHNSNCILASNIESFFGKDVFQLADMYDISLSGDEECDQLVPKDTQAKSKQLDFAKFFELIQQTIEQGSIQQKNFFFLVLSNNAADYLLETEYLSTTRKFWEHWETYKKQKMPTFEEKIVKELQKCDGFNKHLLMQQCSLLCIKNNYNVWSADIAKEWRAFIGLLWRSKRYYRQRWKLVLGNFIVNVVAGIALGLIYGKLGTTQRGVQNRFGSLGFLTIFIGIQSVAGSGLFVEQVFLFFYF
ncbi:hypothetical protein RFI_20105 [Reticulomyxa filosa]|uniref:ABC-2 type transporter transmembrane domain-containing protein n=1 Tax=Reticulomyxa filosa TaxID=46433 RepID=X6MVU6_RETFI|nr:hypothetical protein RFI_20105 [Reticulomyxa filosa]|eukprot:ETO17225.1 hypothetical protein RFI_20105 [Reticulomyxa filosa]